MSGPTRPWRPSADAARARGTGAWKGGGCLGARRRRRLVGARRLRGPGGRWGDALAQVRAQILLIAHARGIGAIEHPFRDIRDSEAGARIADAARADGFTGMFAIHPGQVEGINAAFAPLESEISDAHKIVSAFATNPGAISLSL